MGSWREGTTNGRSRRRISCERREAWRSCLRLWAEAVTELRRENGAAGDRIRYEVTSTSRSKSWAQIASFVSPNLFLTQRIANFRHSQIRLPTKDSLRHSNSTTPIHLLISLFSTLTLASPFDRAQSLNIQSFIP